MTAQCYVYLLRGDEDPDETLTLNISDIKQRDTRTVLSFDVPFAPTPITIIFDSGQLKRYFELRGVITADTADAAYEARAALQNAVNTWWNPIYEGLPILRIQYSDSYTVDYRVAISKFQPDLKPANPTVHEYEIEFLHGQTENA